MLPLLQCAVHRIRSGTETVGLPIAQNRAPRCGDNADVMLALRGLGVWRAVPLFLRPPQHLQRLWKIADGFVR